MNTENKEFKWTDELVKEFGDWYRNTSETFSSNPLILVDRFKQSKQPKEEDKRIMVGVHNFTNKAGTHANGDISRYYEFWVKNYVIPDDKFGAIQKAIESVLNDAPPMPAESIPTLERQDSKDDAFVEKLMSMPDLNKPKQMYAKHCGIHDYNDICKGMKCEEYNPLNPEHK